MFVWILDRAQKQTLNPKSLNTNKHVGSSSREASGWQKPVHFRNEPQTNCAKSKSTNNPGGTKCEERKPVRGRTITPNWKPWWHTRYGCKHVLFRVARGCFNNSLRSHFSGYLSNKTLHYRAWVTAGILHYRLATVGCCATRNFWTPEKCNA